MEEIKTYRVRYSNNTELKTIARFLDYEKALKFAKEFAENIAKNHINSHIEMKEFNYPHFDLSVTMFNLISENNDLIPETITVTLLSEGE